MNKYQRWYDQLMEKARGSHAGRDEGSEERDRH
jgi:hypothetical protein